MNALERVRDKFKSPQVTTDKTDKSPSVSSVSSHPWQIGNCQQLDIELECRLRNMAKRWSYTDADLTNLLIRAAMDPSGWLLTVNRDELMYGASDEKVLL